MRELQPGEVVDGLVVKNRLSNGGMGVVYVARDERLGVDRALKVFALTGPGFHGRDDESDYKKRFDREARHLARLRHPNIVPIHQSGDIEGNPYIVMTYFPSKDGRRWMVDEVPTVERIKNVALQAARGLAHAHDHGVLHRDIKLANVLIGNSDETMLIDFGLAKASTDPEFTHGGRIGTWAYLAPEYVKASMAGPAQHTVATDLWALGVVLYAFTCRRRAFGDKDSDKLLRMIARSEFIPVGTAAPDTPPEWATLIHQLMEPDPKRRIPSAHDLVKRLDAVSLRAPTSPAPVELAVVPVATAADSAELPGATKKNVAAASEKLAAAADEAAAASAPAPPSVPAAPQPAPSPPPVDARAEDNEDEQFVEPDTSSGSLFSHRDPDASAASIELAQVSFQPPPAPASIERAKAKRRLLLPLAAALSVFLAGAVVIIWSTHFAGASRNKSTTYVDPDEIDRKRRADKEVEDIDREKRDRHAFTTADERSLTVPLFAPSIPPLKAAEPPPRRTAHARTEWAQESTPKAPPDIWALRYGTRTNFNTSPSLAPSPSSPATVATGAKPSAAGLRIPVHVNNTIASSPIGPVIAYVDAPVVVDGVELTRGTELHGRVSGASGPRILVEFSFAIASGKNIPLRGSALGLDGRAGIPAAKNLGGVSDVGAAAAAGASQALVGAASALVGNDIARGALQGAGSRAAGKTSRFDNEEEVVATEHGVHFLIYLEAAS